MRKRNEHIMRLSEPFFTQVLQLKKTVEMRIYDEKRRNVSCGDIITFFCADDDDKSVDVKVCGVEVFEDFYALASSYPARELGFEGKSAEHIAEFMNELYGERAKNSSVIAIEFIDYCKEDEI